MIEIFVAALLSSVLSGGAGFLAATVRQGTKLALLEREHILIKQQADKIESRLKMVLRLTIDIARKNNVEIRAADILEMADVLGGEGVTT